MNGVDASDLCEEFHKDVLSDGWVEITDVACGFLVAMLDVGEGGHDVGIGRFTGGWPSRNSS